MGTSYMKGKAEVIGWIRDRLGAGSTILDVGVGDGIWGEKLHDKYHVVGVEIWKPYIDALEDKGWYIRIENRDIDDYHYQYYDLVILGDVVEHMSVGKATRVLEYAKEHARDHIVAVPWLYEQGEKNGNRYEVHLQPDLTPEVFEERYPGYKVLWQDDNYAYFHWGDAKGLW